MLLCAGALKMRANRLVQEDQETTVFEEDIGCKAY
jgi:hypothetical protein